MLIATDQLIAGLPAVEARRLMRAIREYAVTVGVIADELGVTREKAVDTIDRLSAEGFVCRVDADERSGLLFLDDEAASAADAARLELWGTTIAGNALSKARVGKPITRRKAQALLDGLLARVAQVNADPDSLFVVERVEVFGSFVDDTRDLVGDVDVHVVFDRRVHGDEFIRRALDVAEEAEDAGRRFSSHLDRLSFAEREFYRFLRNRSPRLDIQFDPVGDGARLPEGATVRVVFSG